MSEVIHWIKHYGSERPISETAYVEVRFETGRMLIDYAKNLQWVNSKTGNPIEFYRLLEPAAQIEKAADATREKKLKFVGYHGSGSTSTQALLNQAVYLFGKDWLTDDQVDDLVRVTIKRERSISKFNQLKRARAARRRAEKSYDIAEAPLAEKTKRESGT